LKIDALKFHHLQVIKDTPLHKMYQDNLVETFSLQSYFDLMLRVLPLVPQDVTIHRLWATAHPDLLVAPKWNVLASHLSQQLRALMKERGLYQGKHALE